MFRVLFIIGLGGALGSIARYLVNLGINKIFSTIFPLGIFSVNIIGCLMIGIALGLLQQTEWFTTEWKLFIITGFCGGFTTFSTFTANNIELLEGGHFLYFSLYTILSIALGIASAMFGFWLITRYV